MRRHAHRSSAPVDFIAVGLTDGDIDRAGGTTTGRVGAVVTGRAPGAALPRLAQVAAWLDAPQPLRPALDDVRRQIGAVETDEGRDFSSALRGTGAIIAAYDSGVDLLHPDLRRLDGATRVLALWDQQGVGTPPAAGFGAECAPDSLATDTCPFVDPSGHGTAVLAAAASSGPRYRGVAPDADLIVIKSDSRDGFIPALSYAADVAATLDRPMVFTVAFTGALGPHDGTSLEAQAIDAYGHPVVVAAGNLGDIPTHATTTLIDGVATAVVLRFPPLATALDRRATVEIWGPPGADSIEATVELRQPDGTLVVRTASIAPGDPGRTEVLTQSDATVGTVDLDASAVRSPFNDRASIRIDLSLVAWQDPPAGESFVAVGLAGEGEVHLWVDGPGEPTPVRFDRDGLFDGQVLGDTQTTLSDPATATTAIAVAAYTHRNQIDGPDGTPLSFPDPIDRIASYSGRGPSLRPDVTGPKPDLAAPGQYVVTARSRAVPESDEVTISSLYRVSAGTSISSGLVAGAAAVLLGARPDLSRDEVKRILLANTSAPLDDDPRWGAGRLNVSAAAAEAVGREDGCSCRSAATTGSTRENALACFGAVALGLMLVVVRRGRMIRPLGARLGRHQA